MTLPAASSSRATLCRSSWTRPRRIAPIVTQRVSTPRRLGRDQQLHRCGQFLRATRAVAHPAGCPQTRPRGLRAVSHAGPRVTRPRADAVAEPLKGAAERSVNLSVLAALAILAPLSVNISLPVLPAIGYGFEVGVPRTQLTLGVLPVGLGLGQGIGAPMTDQYGRWPAVLLGVVVFGATTMGIFVCGSANPFTRLRLVPRHRDQHCGGECRNRLGRSGRHSGRGSRAQFHRCDSGSGATCRAGHRHCPSSRIRLEINLPCAVCVLRIPSMPAVAPAARNCRHAGARP